MSELVLVTIAPAAVGLTGRHRKYTVLSIAPEPGSGGWGRLWRRSPLSSAPHHERGWDAPRTCGGSVMGAKRANVAGHGDSIDHR